MSKIQERTIKKDKIDLLLADKSAVLNYSIVKTNEEKKIAIEIFDRQATKRHDLQVYSIIIERTEFCAILLIKRNKLDENHYFREDPIEVELKEGIKIKDVLNDEDTLNWAIVSEKETFYELVDILNRSKEYCLHPSRVDIVHITNYDDKPLLLLMKDLNWSFFKNDVIQKEEEEEK